MARRCGHPTGWRGGRIGASNDDGPHQVKWRGLGNGPWEGGPSVAPGFWRDPEPGVVGGRESSDATAAGLAPVQVNGGVGDGLPRVKCGGAVGRRERGGAYHGGRPRAASALLAGDSTDGGGGHRGGRGGTGRGRGGPNGERLPSAGAAPGAPPGNGGGWAGGRGVARASPVDAPPRPHSVGGVSPVGPIRGHSGAEAGPSLAAVADASPRAVRATCRGDGGPSRLTRGGGRAVGGARGRALVQT